MRIGSTEVTPSAKQTALLAALGGFRDPEVGVILRRLYGQLTPRLQANVQRLLCEEPARALATLEAVNRGEFDPGAFSSANLALLRGHSDPRIRAELERHLAVRAGDAASQGAQRLFETGRVAYSLTCAPCHQEAGEGRVGLAAGLDLLVVDEAHRLERGPRPGGPGAADRQGRITSPRHKPE